MEADFECDRGNVSQMLFVRAGFALKEEINDLSAINQDNSFVVLEVCEYDDPTKVSTFAFSIQDAYEILCGLEGALQIIKENQEGKNDD